MSFTIGFIIGIGFTFGFSYFLSKRSMKKLKELKFKHKPNPIGFKMTYTPKDETK